MTAYSQAVMWQVMEKYVSILLNCLFLVQKLWEMQNYFKYSNFLKAL